MGGSETLLARTGFVCCLPLSERARRATGFPDPASRGMRAFHEALRKFFRKTTMMIRIAAFIVASMLTYLASFPVLAQAPLHDPNLPTVKPEALQQLSDNRIRYKIMRESQAFYPRRCVCPYQTRDSAGRSCKGRHELVKTGTRPICYPGQVSKQMINDWRHQQP